MKLFIVLFVLMIYSGSSHAQNKTTLAQCADFKNHIASNSNVHSGYYMAPLTYKSGDSRKIPIFYWVRKGSNPHKVPVLLIHGGPGGNSWRYYDTFKDIAYDGDIVAIDNRNEGCSNTSDYNLDPGEYVNFRSRYVVMDLEVLRAGLYGANSQWRVFGQSRGTPIAHQYFEMYPDALESVQTHGFAMELPVHMINYTYSRSLFNVRGSNRFFQKFPQVENIFRQVRVYFKENNICLPMNFDTQNLPVTLQPKVCGSIIADSVSYKLSNFARWSEIAAEFASLQNPDGSLNQQKAISTFQDELNGNIYVGFMNYIMGTNGKDVASPSPQMFKALTSNIEIMSSLISEGRFVALAVYPAYLQSGGSPFVASVDMIDFNRVKATLQNYEMKNHKKFPFVIFSSLYDTIAGPELYNDEVRLLSPYVELFPLNNSGHEGWGTEPQVRQILFR